LIHFVFGGARSGKSRYAEDLAKQAEIQGKKIIYIATAPQYQDKPDEEMAERILRHQAQRPNHWQTVECSIELANAISENTHGKSCIIADCLTLWTLSLIEGQCLQAQQKALFDLLKDYDAELVLVSNEVGLGVIPMGSLTRQFVDEQGRLHQEVARLADEVVFMAAGLPMILKS